MPLNLRKASEARQEERELEKNKKEAEDIDQDALLLSSMGVSEDEALADALFSGEGSFDEIETEADPVDEADEIEDVDEADETEETLAADDTEDIKEDALTQTVAKAVSGRRSGKAKKVEDAVSSSIKNRRANRKERARLYDEGDIVELRNTNGIRVDSAAAERRATFHELSVSSVEGRPLYGTITKSAVIEGVPVAIVTYGCFDVYIPITELLVNIPADEDIDCQGKAILTYKKLLIDYRIYSEIDFIVTKVDEMSLRAVASRRKAMAKIAKTYYIDPDFKGERVVRKGRKVDARIVAVSPKFLIAEIFGIEVVIPVSEASYVFTPDLRSIFENGMIVKTLIQDVNIDKSGHIKVTASIKQAEEDTRLVELAKYSTGQKVVGVVEALYSDGCLVTAGSKKDHKRRREGMASKSAPLPVQIKCRASKIQETPRIGDECIVLITGINTKEGQGRGEIVYIM